MEIAWKLLDRSCSGWPAGLARSRVLMLPSCTTLSLSGHWNQILVLSGAALLSNRTTLPLQNSFMLFI